MRLSDNHQLTLALFIAYLPFILCIYSLYYTLKEMIGW